MSAIFSKTRGNPCGYLDDAKRLWTEKICLEPVSKNLRGKLDLLNRERQECKEPKCLTLKTDHLLKVDVESHDCDSQIGRRLDGVLVVRRLVHALADGTGFGRGVHTGEFVWVGSGIEVHGELSGMTNEGTHREPPFDPCQECKDPGWMEGRLCGRIVKAEKEELIGCRVVAAYRFKFEPSEGFRDTEIHGTLEGVVVCRCDEGKCINFSSFPEAEHPNPWEINGCQFQVFDHTGTPHPNTAVVAMGGAYLGLNAGYHTRITLPQPASEVSITLINYSTPASATAVDSGGNLVDSAAMSSSGTPETLVLTGPGIAAVDIRSPQNETLILEFCVQR